MSNLYGVYDLSNHEQCVMITERIREIAKFLNKKEKYIRDVIRYDKTVTRKYKIICLGDEHDL